MSMGDEERFACPKCGASVSKGDRFCKNCGTSLLEVSVPVLPEEKAEGAYERKFSLGQRFYKLLTAPSEAMEDIALAPDYGGVAVIIVIEAVLTVLSLVLGFQKIQFVGAYAQTILGFVSLILAIGSMISIGVIGLQWLIESVIIKYCCDSGSSWDFKVAASITGYAYIASIIMSILSGCISWFLMPSFTVDTSDLQMGMQAVNEYRAQLSWFMLVYSLPVSLVGLVWKSYLGGLGAHFGTKKRCSVGMGIAVFFILGLLGLLASFLFSNFAFSV